MASATPKLVGTEPKTPLWLTCLGGGLFLAAGLFLVFRAPPVERAEKAEKSVTAVSAAPSAPAAAMQAPGKPLDPERMKRLSERLKGAGMPTGAPGGAAPVPPAGGH